MKFRSGLYSTNCQFSWSRKRQLPLAFQHISFELLQTRLGIATKKVLPTLVIRKH